MRPIKAIGMLAVALAASGCASIIRGTKQDFAIQSTPSGATANLSTGQNCVTPCDLHLPRKNPFSVTFSLPGYEVQTVEVNSGWSDGGTKTFIIGNVIAGGLIGMGVDAANGAARDLTPNPLVVTLTPVAPPIVAPAATERAAPAAVVTPEEPTAAPAEPAPASTQAQ